MWWLDVVQSAPKSHTEQRRGKFSFTNQWSERYTMRARRGTKDDVVQARIPRTDKAVLQRYAESQDMTLSDLIRRTIKHLSIQIQRQEQAGTTASNPPPYNDQQTS